MTQDNLKYKYSNKIGPVTISTPFCSNESDIKVIQIDQDYHALKRLLIYPRNFIVYTEQRFDGYLVKTNYPLVQRPDGTYNVDFLGDY
jgi:hypothetical protein